MRYIAFSWLSFFKFPFCLIPSSLLHPPFFLLQVHPLLQTHLAVYCSFHGFFILLQHVAIQTPLNSGGCSSFYKIRILLYSTSCIGPRKLDSRCFLQFRYRVLGLPLLHGQCQSLLHSLSQVKGTLFPLLWSPEAASVSLSIPPPKYLQALLAPLLLKQ